MAPARPESAPESMATSTSVQATGTPVNRAATGLAPRALISKPQTVHFSRNQSSAEKGQRDRQIEMRPFFWQIGGREVDGDTLGRESDSERGKGRPHSFLCFGNCLVGQTDDGKSGKAGRDGALNLDSPRLDAFESHGVGDRSQGQTLSQLGKG